MNNNRPVNQNIILEVYGTGFFHLKKNLYLWLLNILHQRRKQQRRRAATTRLTHDAFLRCWRDDVAYVQVFGCQFAVQAQKVAETPFY